MGKQKSSQILTAFNFLLFSIALGSIFIFGVVIGFICDDIKFGAIFSLIVGFFFGIAVGFGDGIPVEYETQYKVTISDEVQMNSFLERYELLDQEGKIYTVREK